MTIVAIVAGASLTGAAGAQVPIAGKKLTVTPAKGGPTSRFVVQFTTAYPTGTSGGTIRTIELKASGPASAPKGCIDRIAMPVTVTVPGLQRVSMSVRPRWCAGTYSGSITETIRPNCQPGVACPQYIALMPIGTFSFLVR